MKMALNVVIQTEAYDSRRIIVVGDIWYRYHETNYAAPINEWGDVLGEGTVEVKEEEYLVVKVTPCGVQVIRHWKFISVPDWEYRHFINRNWRKKYASPTKALALEAFRARKRKNISIYEARIRSINKALEYAKRFDV